MASELNNESLKKREEWSRWQGNVTERERSELIRYGLRTVLAESVDDDNDADTMLEGCFAESSVSPTPSWDRIARFEFQMATQTDLNTDIGKTIRFLKSNGSGNVRAERALVRWSIATGEKMDEGLLANLPVWEQFYFRGISAWSMGRKPSVESLLRESIGANPWQNPTRFALGSFLAKLNPDAALEVISHEFVIRTSQIELLKSWILWEDPTSGSECVEPLRYTWAKGDAKRRKVAKQLFVAKNSPHQKTTELSDIPALIEAKDWKGIRKIAENNCDDELASLLQTRLALQSLRTRDFDGAEASLKDILSSI